MKLLEKLWQERALKYQYAIEGVLIKSLPRKLNDYIDSWTVSEQLIHLNKKRKLTYLDVGCGYGRISERIIKNHKNINVIGCDISEEYVDLFNKKLNPKAHAVKANIINLPFKDATFDMISIVTVLMYVIDQKDQVKAVREILRVLKPNGIVIAIEPTSLHKLLNIWPTKNIPFSKNIPMTSFSRNRLQGLFVKLGVKTISVHGIPFWTMLLPILYIGFAIDSYNANKFLSKIRSIDNALKNLTFFSLYISYTGVKI